MTLSSWIQSVCDLIKLHYTYLHLPLQILLGRIFELNCANNINLARPPPHTQPTQYDVLATVDKPNHRPQIQATQNSSRNQQIAKV